MAEEVPDLYEVLSVQRWADHPLIAAQYQRKHDAYVEAGQDTEELEEAYVILSDPESRDEYDEMLFAYDAEEFQAELDSEEIEHSGGGGWSVSKVISWGFSAFILLSIVTGLCERVRG